MNIPDSRCNNSLLRLGTFSLSPAALAVNKLTFLANDLVVFPFSIFLYFLCFVTFFGIFFFMIFLVVVREIMSSPLLSVFFHVELLPSLEGLVGEICYTPDIVFLWPHLLWLVRVSVLVFLLHSAQGWPLSVLCPILL